MEIIPFTSVGLLTFGETREILQAQLGTSFSTFQKVAGENETDSYDNLGLHLYYDNADRLEFVEAFLPADVTFRGIAFLGRHLEQLVLELRSLGFAPTVSDVGVRFEGVGIALAAPYGLVEGVAAHRKGYYSRRVN
jgi:hypothetical protein